SAMKNLSPRERKIISLRRLSESPSTLDDLGKSLQISKERVRQLESRAIRKMRYHLLHSIQDAKDLLLD
ncbi:sigma factor-like helix-turn-helix DNA-binding protein, partial [Acinetobacter baumannii]